MGRGTPDRTKGAGLPRLPPALLGLALGLAVGCGSEAPMPVDGPPVLTRLLAPALSDTIEASPEGAYALSLRNLDGTAVVGTPVTFSAENVEVAEPGGSFSESAAQVTDSRGEVAVLIRFGDRTGEAVVVARVPTAGLSDTLTVEVLPGATVAAAWSPGDTVVAVGVPFSASALPVDRRGNATGDPLSVHVESGPLAASDDDFVGTDVGSGVLWALANGAVSWITVTVVPDGQIVYTRGSEAWLASFDGTEARKLDFVVPPVREPSVSWNRSGDRIVLGGVDGFVVFDLGSGAVLPSSWPAAAGSNVIWPRFGPADTVYYSSWDGASAWDLRQMAPDGSSPRVTIATGRFTNNDFFPDWAPDGSSFVFTADWEQRNRFLLRLSDPTATTITTLDVEGVTPVWSPDGGRIAYQELGVVGVVSPDGSGHRSWKPGWSKGVTWSPSGDMLVGISAGRVALLDAGTGVELVLEHFGLGVDAVAWRPAGASPSARLAHRPGTPLRPRASARAQTSPRSASGPFSFERIRKTRPGTPIITP